MRAGIAAGLLLTVAACDTSSVAHGPPSVARIGGVIEVSFDTTRQGVQNDIASRCGLQAVETPPGLGPTHRWYRDPGGDGRVPLMTCAGKDPHVLYVALPV